MSHIVRLNLLTYLKRLLRDANFEFKGKYSYRFMLICQNSYCNILQGSVATLFRRSWKILSYFVANLSKTLRINFYQNRSSIVEVMISGVARISSGGVAVSNCTDSLPLSLPSPSLPFTPFPSLPFPLPSPSFPPLPSLPLEVGPP